MSYNVLANFGAASFVKYQRRRVIFVAAFRLASLLLLSRKASVCGRLYESHCVWESAGVGKVAVTACKSLKQAITGKEEDESFQVTGFLQVLRDNTWREWQDPCLKSEMWAAGSSSKAKTSILSLKAVLALNEARTKQQQPALQPLIYASVLQLIKNSVVLHSLRWYLSWQIKARGTYSIDVRFYTYPLKVPLSDLVHSYYVFVIQRAYDKYIGDEIVVLALEILP